MGDNKVRRLKTPNERIERKWKGQRFDGKVRGEESPFGETSLELPITQADKVEVMQWEKMTSYVNEPTFEFGLTLSPTPNNKKGGLLGPNTELVEETSIGGETKRNS